MHLKLYACLVIGGAMQDVRCPVYDIVNIGCSSYNVLGCQSELKAKEREMRTPPTPSWGTATFTVLRTIIGPAISVRQAGQSLSSTDATLFPPPI